MPAQDKSDLFQFMLERVKETQKQHLEGEPQAFGRWFADLFFMSPRDIFVSDRSERIESLTYSLPPTTARRFFITFSTPNSQRSSIRLRRQLFTKRSNTSGKLSKTVLPEPPIWKKP